MNILLISGHGAGDSGAIGNGYQEQAITREITENVKNAIGNKANVTIYPQERNAYYDIENGFLVRYIQQNNFDYVLEVHLNSGGTPYGTGTEIFVTTLEEFSTVEQEIVNRLATIYPPARSGGVKVMDFGVIRTIKNLGISSALVETLFINNPNEVAVYQQNKGKTAQLIADGLIAGFGLNGGSVAPAPAPKPTPQPPTTNLEAVADAVIRGDYGNGEDRKKNLKASGYDYAQVQAIVDSRYGSKPAQPSMSARQFAWEVWNSGKHGTGQARKDNASRLGVDYNEAQRLINLLANGGNI